MLDIDTPHDNSEVSSQQNEPFEGVNDTIEFWRDPPEIIEHGLDSNVAEVFSYHSLPNYINDLFYSENRTADMTNLAHILMGYSSEEDPMHNDSSLGRLSLAHEKLTYFPKVLCDEFGPVIKILDITDNEITNLDFLDNFTALTTLIADKNPINSLDTNIPFMANLELLYLNRCKIEELYWVETLRYNCPKLRYLSLMGNPVAPSLCAGDNFYEYLQYRLYVISVIPTLVHLDDKKITPDERSQAKKIFPTPFVLNLYRTTKARLPAYFKKLTNRMTGYFTAGPSGREAVKQENNYVI